MFNILIGFFGCFVFQILFPQPAEYIRGWIWAQWKKLADKMFLQPWDKE